MKRFQTPVQGRQFQSEYDFPSDLLIDLNQRDISPIQVITLNLGSAGTQLIPYAGRGFVPYFYQTGSALKTRMTAAQFTAYINAPDAGNPNVALTCKHNRGFRGSFSQLFLSWPAQSNVSVDIVIFRSQNIPWMTDAVSASSAGNVGLFAFTKAITGNYTGTATDNFVQANATTGVIAVTTPPPSNGQIFSVIKTDATANTVTVSGNVFDGSSKVLNFRGDSVSLWSDGTSWFPFA